MRLNRHESKGAFRHKKSMGERTIFKQIGTAKTGRSKSGREYIRLFLDKSLLKGISGADLGHKIFLFKTTVDDYGQRYSVCAPVISKKSDFKTAS